MQPSQDINNIQPTTDIPANTGGVVFQDRPKKNTAMVLGMVLLAVLAIGGIGFGVWEMMDGNNRVVEKDKQIAELNSKLAENNQPVSDETVVDDDVADDVVNTGDYIYVGEWGTKIKISEGLSNISYEFLGDGYHRSCRTLGLSASTKGDGSEPSFVKTGGDDGNYLGYVMRCPKEDLYPYGTPIDISDSNYSYYYDPIQYSITQTDWESESVEAVKSMLTNPENYSKF